MRERIFWSILLVSLVSWGGASGQSAGPAPAKEAELPAAITVAVLDFEAKEAGGADMGSKIGDLLTIYLSTLGDFEMVERSKLKEVLGEQELSLSGAVDPNQAIEVGRLVGAKLMVFGRAFAMDDQLYFTAKVVSTETSRVAGALVKVEMSDELTDAVEALAGELVETIETKGRSLGVVAKRIDPVKAIGEALKDLKDVKLPSAVVIIPEQHLTRMVIDPAAETEFQAILKGIGVTVYEAKSKVAADWARAFMRSGRGALPAEVRKADLVIVGEGFSEPAGRYGQLHSCKGRLEVKIIDRKTGEILAVDSSNTAAIDLSENTAGKKALQKAARNLALRLLPTAIKQWVRRSQ